MRDYQEDPVLKHNMSYGLFLIRNPANLNQTIFDSLLKTLRGVIVSFEHIQKGESSVLVSYLPVETAGKFPSLGLTEIEDYLADKEQPALEEYIRLRQININDSFAWSLLPKRKNNPVLSKTGALLFDLTPDQYAVLQIVVQPSEQGVQINSRMLIKEPDPHTKIRLIKQIKEGIDLKTSLTNNPGLLHPAVFADFKKRASIPRHAQSFIVSEAELLKFIN